MNSFKLYKTLYTLDAQRIVGGRVSRSQLSRALKNDALVDEAISKLYVECPTKFPGERKDEKHYLLKTKWYIINHIFLTAYISYKEPLHTFRYISWFFKDMINIPANNRYYMHPTQVNRYGK